MLALGEPRLASPPRERRAGFLSIMPSPWDLLFGRDMTVTASMNDLQFLARGAVGLQGADRVTERSKKLAPKLGLRDGLFRSFGAVRAHRSERSCGKYRAR
jgi:hypothetical protein